MGPTQSHQFVYFSNQLIPGPFPSEPPQQVSATERFFETGFRKSLKEINQTLFKTWLLSEILVSKNQGLVSGSPPGGLYFQKMTPTNKNVPKRWKNEKLAKNIYFALGPRGPDPFLPAGGG